MFGTHPSLRAPLSSRHPLSSDGRARTPTLNLNHPVCYTPGGTGLVPTTPFHTRVYRIYCSFDSPTSLRADVPSGLLPSFGIIVWILVRRREAVDCQSCVGSGWKLIRIFVCDGEIVCDSFFFFFFFRVVD